MKKAAFVIIVSLWAALQSCEGAVWLAGPSDGSTLYVCAGDDLMVPWTYTLNSGDVLQRIDWYYYGGGVQELLATFPQGVFLPGPTFGDRVHSLSNAGVLLSHVTVGDSGTYSVRVTGHAVSGSSFGFNRSVNVHVADQLLTYDGHLQLTESPVAVLDVASGEWTLELHCGQFLFSYPPPFDVEWITPQGATLHSSAFRDGHFVLHLPSPVTGGAYTCRVRAQLPMACILNDTQDTWTVDLMQARLVILETRQAYAEAKFRNDTEHLLAENLSLRQQLASTTSSLSSRITARERCLCHW